MVSATKTKHHLITTLLAGCRSTKALIHGVRVYKKLLRLISLRFAIPLKEQSCHWAFPFL